MDNLRNIISDAMDSLATAITARGDVDVSNYVDALYALLQPQTISEGEIETEVLLSIIGFDSYFDTDEAEALARKIAKAIYSLLQGKEQRGEEAKERCDKALEWWADEVVSAGNHRPIYNDILELAERASGCTPPLKKQEEEDMKCLDYVADLIEKKDSENDNGKEGNNVKR